MTDVPLVAIAKGPDRDAGREWFHMDGRAAVPAARRAIRCSTSCSGSGTKRIVSRSRPIGPAVPRSLTRSELDEVPGIGAARKRALLNHFGSARGVKQAGLADLEAAPGISRETARRVYAHFHPGVQVGGHFLIARRRTTGPVPDADRPAQPADAIAHRGHPGAGRAWSALRAAARRSCRLRRVQRSRA